MDDPAKITSRFLMVQRITDQFLKVWNCLYLPSLIVRQKWHHQRRNLAVGDICLLKDSNSLRGDWRICRVVQTMPDSKGTVRNVRVNVASRYDGGLSYNFQKPYTLSRHVSNLIVIVPIDIDETDSAIVSSDLTTSDNSRDKSRSFNSQSSFLSSQF